MLGDWFYWVLNMSIAAALAGLPVLLVRLIRAVPRRVSVFLWLIPFLRMTVPVSIDAPWSVMNLVGRLCFRTVTVWEPWDGVALTAINGIRAASGYFPIVYRVNLLEKIFSTGGVIWIIGAAALWLTGIILYAGTLRELEDAEPLGDKVYRSQKVQGPAVYGIFRPKIILPPGLTGETAEYVLLHERTHIRRGDNFWRVLAFAAAAVHWFNPLAWIFLKLFLEDLELTCDEAVAARLGENERRSYASALVGCAEEQSVFASAFGGAKIRTRIERILSFKGMTAFSAVAFALLAAVVILTLVTNGGGT